MEKETASESSGKTDNWQEAQRSKQEQNMAPAKAASCVSGDEFFFCKGDGWQ